LIETILFDLDGTLTDPKEGITRCIQYALVELGFPAPTQEELLWCIGPPLTHSFEKLLPADKKDLAWSAVHHYRKRFGEVGLFENELYPFIPALLEKLKLSHRLFVCTSKPHVYARKIVEHFKLTHFFEEIYGCELTGERMDKGELIAYILEKENLAAKTCVMIGDREHDVIGAKKNGLKNIGITWGYGSHDEHLKAQADVICHTSSEVSEFILRNQTR
jgi:phosphoglycolate phosphatase